ncbi:MAG: hypothetical protein QME68_05235 [Elusimicrobiota bacterium]|nr:hypothetical protein [Elusimicrobiota bacterium]
MNSEKDGQEIIILGESQSRIFKDPVDEFAKKFMQIQSIIKKQIFKFTFGFWVHPSAIEIANKKNINLIATYQLRELKR